MKAETHYSLQDLFGIAIKAGDIHRDQHVHQELCAQGKDAVHGQ